ncbi:hypothetical protein [Rahnella contaminans]|uniref:hypothetical protein n=1 Tax=Rahnella contaminans TaxID=2703882 RepID=UPI0023DB14B4|nr:hypothetical protein [Rahnella contaminans]
MRLRRTDVYDKVKTLGSPPKLAQRLLNETLWNPAFLNCALSLGRWTCLGTLVCGAKYCLCAVPSLGLRATGLEAAPFSKIFNHAISLSEKQIGFEFKIVRAIQKSCRTERPEDPGLQDREREPRSGKISSLSQRLLKHSQRATARSKKARRVQRGKALSSLLGFSAKGHVITAHEKPKLSPSEMAVPNARPGIQIAHPPA